MVNVIARKLRTPDPGRLTVCQSMWCNYRVISLETDYVIDIWPEENWPNGRESKGIGIAWSMARHLGHPGLLLLGCDVAADLDDLDAMTDAVNQLPEDLHTGMVKLWPQSTERDHWMWSHRGGTLGKPAVLEDGSAPVSYVSLGFLWVPGRLLDLATPDIDTWAYGQTDVKLSELALAAGIPAHAVQACRPKHLHFQGEHDGEHIRQRSGHHHTASDRNALAGQPAQQDPGGRHDPRP